MKQSSISETGFPITRSFTVQMMFKYMPELLDGDAPSPFYLTQFRSLDGLDTHWVFVEQDNV